MIKKHFNKNIVMSVEDEGRFQSSNKSWICNKLFTEEDKKERDRDHITGKYRGSVHSNCNINLKLTKKVPAIFHNLIGYDGHLIMQGISTFDVEICVIPNGLEKYMAFTINKNLIFIDSIQFLTFSLDVLVKNLSDNYFQHLLQEFNGDLLKLIKEKEYIHMNTRAVSKSFLKNNYLIDLYFIVL